MDSQLRIRRIIVSAEVLSPQVSELDPAAYRHGILLQISLQKACKVVDNSQECHGFNMSQNLARLNLAAEREPSNVLSSDRQTSPSHHNRHLMRVQKHLDNLNVYGEWSNLSAHHSSNSVTPVKVLQVKVSNAVRQIIDTSALLRCKIYESQDTLKDELRSVRSSPIADDMHCSAWLPGAWYCFESPTRELAVCHTWHHVMILVIVIISNRFNDKAAVFESEVGAIGNVRGPVTGLPSQESVAH